MVEREMVPLEINLMALNVVLADYIDHTSIGMVGRLRYAVKDRCKLEDLRANLTKSRTNFGLMLDLVTLEAHEKHARDGRVSRKKLYEILDKQDREAKARKGEAKTRAKSDAKVDEILRILQQCFPEAAACSLAGEGEGNQTNEILDKLKKEMVSAGSSGKKAHAACKSAAEGLASHESARVQSPLNESVPTALPQLPTSPVAHQSPVVTSIASGVPSAKPNKSSVKSSTTPAAAPGPSIYSMQQTASKLPKGIIGKASVGISSIEDRGSPTSKRKAVETPDTTTCERPSVPEAKALRSNCHKRLGFTGSSVSTVFTAVSQISRPIKCLIANVS